MQSERADLIAQLKALGVENRNFNIVLDEKKKDMEPLHEALGKLRHANTGGRGSGLCSSEEELNLLVGFILSSVIPGDSIMLKLVSMLFCYFLSA